MPAAISGKTNYGWEADECAGFRHSRWVHDHHVLLWCASMRIIGDPVFADHRRAE
jgi:hypothetical protein